MGELLRKHMNQLTQASTDYRTALNVLIKYEIQCLLERLSSTGEEAVVITTSIDDGCPGFLGSVKGEKFIEDNKTLILLHSQLIDYCKVDESPDEGSVSKQLHEDRLTSGHQGNNGNTGPDWPGRDHVTPLPSNRQTVTQLPSSSRNMASLPSNSGNTSQLPSDNQSASERDDHVTSNVDDCVSSNRDDNSCYSSITPHEIKASLSKKIASKYFKRTSWNEERLTAPDTKVVDLTTNNTEEKFNWEYSKCSMGYKYLGDNSPSNSWKDCESVNKPVRRDSHCSGLTGDRNALLPYNGNVEIKNEYGYRYSGSEENDDNVEALDFSMSSSQTVSKVNSDTDECEDLTIPKPRTSTVSESSCLSPSSKTYPFLTRELFTPGKMTEQSGNSNKKMRTERSMSLVEDMSSEKSNNFFNDLYLQNVVKMEPCDNTPVKSEYSSMDDSCMGGEMSDIQYMCASRLLRHTELPNSPLQLKFTCKTCGEVFKNRQFRDLHVKLHKNAKQFVCTLCGVGFDIEDEFKAHQKVHCEPLLMCEDCGYRCTREFRMKSHKEICGSPAKVYKCPFCNKPFAAKRYMNIHMKSHDIRNINPCPFCPNVYPLKNSLLKHIKKKHGVSKFENC